MCDPHRNVKHSNATFPNFPYRLHITCLFTLLVSLSRDPIAAGGSGGTYFAVPYWFFVFVCGCLVILLQLRWPPRFSTRQLFTSTTFLAIVLVMIAWLDWRG
jgi:hypothetical protein